MPVVQVEHTGYDSFQLQRKRIFYIAMQRRVLITCIIALAVVIAIAVGVAVPLSQKSKDNSNNSQSVNAPVTTQQSSDSSTDPPKITAKTAILLPLYIYPTKTSWDPIYSASVFSLRVPCRAGIYRGRSVDSCIFVES